MKKYYNIELTSTEWATFRNGLKSHGIQYEASGAGHLIHVELLCDEREYNIASVLLEEV